MRLSLGPGLNIGQHGRGLVLDLGLGLSRGLVLDLVPVLEANHEKPKNEMVGV